MWILGPVKTSLLAKLHHYIAFDELLYTNNVEGHILVFFQYNNGHSDLLS